MRHANSNPKQRAPAADSAAPVSKLSQPEQQSSSLSMQRALGNQAVGRMFQPASDRAAGPGQPLDPATRSFFEPRFAQNFGHVRVHTDARSAQSAKALSALAYTRGSNIVFGAGQYSPASPAGQRLLAHELTHVVQQGEGAQEPGLIQRAPDPAVPAAPPAAAPAPPAVAPATPAVAPDAQIRQWLDLHQFAPPVKQPEKPEDERHVLLNGEDMTISSAVQLAVAALQQPPELVSSVITALLAKPIATSASGLPFIGPNNETAGINLAGPRDAFGINPAISRTIELSSIDDFLTAHGFATPEVRDPTATRVLLDGKITSVDEVAARALAILGQYPTLKKDDVVAHIRQKYVAARGGAGWQLVFGYTLVPKFAQYVGGTPDPLNPLRDQHQFSFTVTRQHHANDSPGFETSLQGSVTLTDHGIQNVQAGGQEAIVKPLLDGWIQVSGLIQVMASENWSKSASGSTVISPAVQATGGGQILLTPTFRSGDYTFINGHAQLGLQVLGGTQTSSSGTVGVFNAGLVLNIPFPL
jgi:hypothetical protein